MKRIYIVLILILILLPGCTKANDKTQQVGDFGFTLKYGVGAKNELNTFEGTFTKDLVIAGTTTTGLRLSNTELNQIYEEMLRIHIMDYPETFKESRNSMVTPFQTYDIYINI